MACVWQPFQAFGMQHSQLSMDVHINTRPWVPSDSYDAVVTVALFLSALPSLEWLSGLSRACQDAGVGPDI